MAGRPKKLALPAGQRFQGLFGLPDVIGTGPRRPGRPAKKPKHDDANPDSQTPDQPAPAAPAQPAPAQSDAEQPDAAETEKPAAEALAPETDERAGPNIFKFYVESSVG